jgi:hypothetical protein
MQEVDRDAEVKRINASWQRSLRNIRSMRAMATKEDLDNRFTYHAPKGDQADRYAALRDHAKGLAEHIVDECPESREKLLALTKLEEAVFWANAAIARHE